MPLIRKAFRRLHYPVDIIAQCVRWYLAYALSLRNLEEMMAERGIVVGHSMLHRWVIRLVPLLDKAFRRHKRAVGCRWRMDETYIKVRGQWKYLYHVLCSYLVVQVVQKCDSRRGRGDAGVSLSLKHLPYQRQGCS